MAVPQMTSRQRLQGEHDVPVRQWVLSLPIGIRYRLACDGKLLSDVLAVFLLVVRGWYYTVYVDDKITARRVRDDELDKYEIIRDEIDADRPVILYIKVSDQNSDPDVSDLGPDLGVGNHYDVVIEAANRRNRFGLGAVRYECNFGWGEEVIRTIKVRGDFGGWTSSFSAFKMNIDAGR